MTEKAAKRLTSQQIRVNASGWVVFGVGPCELDGVADGRGGGVAKWVLTTNCCSVIVSPVAGSMDVCSRAAKLTGGARGTCRVFGRKCLSATAQKKSACKATTATVTHTATGTRRGRVGILPGCTARGRGAAGFTGSDALWRLRRSVSKTLWCARAGRPRPWAACCERESRKWCSCAGCDAP